MTEPYNLDEDESFQRFIDAPLPRTDVWIERVREADAQAERTWRAITESMISPTAEEITAAALCAIAAELRAARIARRPGAGQNYNDIPGAGQRGC